MKNVHDPSNPNRELLLQKWLRGCLSTEASFQFVAGIAFGILGIITLALTSYCAVFLTIFILFRVNAIFSLTGVEVNTVKPVVVICVVLVVVVASFVGAYRHRYGMDYSDVRVRFSSRVSGNVGRGLVNVCCDILFAGPRLFIAAWEHCFTFWRLMRVDGTQVTRVLLWLYEKGTKANVQEISAALPGLNTVRILPQLRDIPGIIWLVANRGVIILSEELRNDLAEALRQDRERSEIGSDSTKRGAHSEEQYQAGMEEASDWYEALGLPPFAPIHEVKKRYRQLAKLYHPDAMGGKAREVEDSAEERMKRINWAYHNILTQARDKEE